MLVYFLVALPFVVELTVSELKIEFHLISILLLFEASYSIFSKTMAEYLNSEISPMIDMHGRDVYGKNLLCTVPRFIF